jgi:hypothetical protein
MENISVGLVCFFMRFFIIFAPNVEFIKNKIQTAYANGNSTAYAKNILVLLLLLSLSLLLLLLLLLLFIGNSCDLHVYWSKIFASESKRI